MIEHDKVPTNPSDGERFACAHCGYTAEFVVLDDGLPGEWLDNTSPSSSAEWGGPERP